MPLPSVPPMFRNSRKSTLLPGPVYIIAATNSRNKYSADYLCDGIHDEVQVQTVVNTIPMGAKVLMLEGDYNFEDEVVVNKKIYIECLGRISLNGAAGTAAFVMGTVTDPRVFGAILDISEINGIDRALGRDAIRFCNARHCIIKTHRVSNVRYLYYFRQDDPVAAYSPANLCYYELVWGCDKGVYFPAGCTSWHEGNQFYGGIIYNTLVCYDFENGAMAGGTMIHSEIDGAWESEAGPYHATNIDYRNLMDANQIGNLVLTSYLRFANATFHWKDIVTGGCVGGANEPRGLITSNITVASWMEINDWLIVKGVSGTDNSEGDYVDWSLAANTPGSKWVAVYGAGGGNIALVPNARGGVYRLASMGAGAPTYKQGEQLIYSLDDNLYLYARWRTNQVVDTVKMIGFTDGLPANANQVSMLVHTGISPDYLLAVTIAGAFLFYDTLVPINTDFHQFVLRRKWYSADAELWMDNNLVYTLGPGLLPPFNTMMRKFEFVDNLGAAVLSELDVDCYRPAGARNTGTGL